MTDTTPRPETDASGSGRSASGTRRLAARWRRLVPPRVGTALAAVALTIAFGLLFWQNAWIADDAQITFRSVEQTFAGHGPRWNPHERVQAFTHPLWFLALCTVRLLTSDLFRGTLALSFLLSLASLALALRSVGPERWRQVALVALLFASKSFIDYSSSGLENPLSILLALAAFRAVSGIPAGEVEASRFVRAALAASLLALTRLDLLLVVAPALALLAAELGRRRGWGSALGSLLLGSSPLLAWSLFATVYYGSPLPNTAFAKLATGIPATALWDKGIDYLLYHLRFDPLSIFLLVAGGLALRTAPRGRALALGGLLYLLYLVRIGGDFMAGRWLQVLVVLGAVALVRQATPARARQLAALALVAALVVPGSPPFHDGVFVGAAALEPKRGDVGSEKSNYFDGWSLRHPERFDEERTGAAQPTLSVAQMIGRRGYRAPLDTIIVDEHALADPFLARLPAKSDSRVGHFRRVVPAGYLESLASGENRLADPTLRRLYDRIALASQGPLWSAARWRAIVALHFAPIDLSDAILAGYRVRVELAAADVPLAPTESLGRIERIRVVDDRIRFEGFLPPMLREAGATLLVVTPTAPLAIDAESSFRFVDETGSRLRADEERSGFRFVMTFARRELAERARESCLYSYSETRSLAPLARGDGGCAVPRVSSDLLPAGNR